MKIEKHGLVMGIERVGDHYFLSITVQGKLTHQDYETITPMIDSALAGIEHPKVDAIVDIQALDGWELRALWDDFKLGLRHGSEFNKVAVCGSRDWQKLAAQIASWFMSGDIQYFDNLEEAMDWLSD